MVATTALSTLFRPAAFLVLLGVVLGAVTMARNHAAHHGAVAPAAVHATHAAMSGHAFSGHAPSERMEHGATTRPAVGAGTSAGTGDAADHFAVTPDRTPATPPAHTTLKLCLAVLIGMIVLRVVVAAWRERRPWHGFKLPQPPVGTIRSLPRPRPPTVKLITSLCVLRQ
ncbi:hypothetical protein [Actinokineospora xionganensis]|uniref:Uncharacterized protein n=1 Tax=Actinokineospora xionganensis TaxID=2684470 RepID=A0ABR7L0K2_9PSEU|nr:hypothetical protein [Actinokineospora xionganensis]MBC6445954.1 hypothetical protein [Actinokineospora xionganensis]